MSRGRWLTHLESEKPNTGVCGTKVSGVSIGLTKNVMKVDCPKCKKIIGKP